MTPPLLTTPGTSQDVQQRVSEPGEVRQEYETFLAQETQEATQRKNKEEIASIKLIQQLQVWREGGWIYLSKQVKVWMWIVLDLLLWIL